MRQIIFSGIVTGLFVIGGCENMQDPDPQEKTEADPLEQLINDGVVSGALNPFDLIERPAYSPVHEIDFMRDDELVFISKACGYVLAYPHSSMYVEVVNEEAHGVLMAVTYCPITRSGIGWNRVVGEDTLLLTASGYLFRENLMPLDLNSGSIWSQMRLQGMTGKHDKEVIQTVPVIETTWKTVKENFPSAGVFVNNTLQKSAPEVTVEQHFGIISRERVELFSLDQFPGEIKLHSTLVHPGGRVIVAGSEQNHFMVAFQTTYRMEPVEGAFPVIMKDETGTYWTIFGEAVEGERGGEKLESPVSYTAAEWAWKDQFDDVIYF